VGGGRVCAGGPLKTRASALHVNIQDDTQATEILHVRRTVKQLPCALGRKDVSVHTHQPSKGTPLRPTCKQKQTPNKATWI
jgi:hypothetical protein